ncbi:glucose dehydrogenase [FAD, quinone]-like [Thrips palmi]|uniref:Glucose dehydrogenase [FAD, quinone]-like n=1 Tax=Thrips palmi TaxID=161013 RepID=A0A6P9A988_THRPL|nr:glucose dehydrogenase [FAD, quinone]-like [Thrips palmi]
MKLPLSTRPAAPRLSLAEMAERLSRNNPLTSLRDARVRDVPDAALLKEYDFVVVGGGTAGCVLANRLSENPSWSVLLLEAGGDEAIFTDIPLLASYVANTNYNWGYHAQPSPDYCRAMKGQACNWPRGKVLGGTSVLNFMVYGRGSPHDFDEWESLGNPGWGYRDVLPYFKRSEDVQVDSLRDSPYHGHGGPLTVTESPWQSPMAPAFLEAASEMGYPVLDHNGPHMTGFSFTLATLRNGSRCSAAKAFLRPVQHRPNLHVVKRARVTRVLVDRATANTVGVEFVRNHQWRVAKARQEVVLSAGTLNSPQILMLSGLGPADHLRALGIPVVRDLPGVGENLQDHVSCFGCVTFLLNDTVSVVESRESRRLGSVVNYWVTQDGPLTSPGGAEGIAFVNTPRNREPDRPDMELSFGPGALSGDSSGSLRGLLGIDAAFFKKMFGEVEGRDAFTVNPVLLRPKSRGRVRLRSANPFHWPLLFANYYADEEDLRVMVEGLKMGVALGETKGYARWGARLHSRPAPGCEQHAFRSDEYWACAARTISTNLHHQSGTCRMGPASDPGAVVDPQLRVHGVRGLRVVDASIMPTIISGHPTGAVYMIAEKAADMIKRAWATDGQLVRRWAANR